MISRMQDLQLQDKAVTLLNSLWDEVSDAKAFLAKQLNHLGNRMEWYLLLEN